MSGRLALPRLRSPCFGRGSLEVASRIIALLYLFGLLADSLFLDYTGVAEERAHFNRTDHPRPEDISIYFRDELLIGGNIRAILVALFLLRGIRKREVMWIEPFLLTFATDILNDLISVGCVAIARVFKYRSITIFIDLAFIVIKSYLFVVVFSYHEELQENRPIN